MLQSYLWYPKIATQSAYYQLLQCRNTETFGQFRTGQCCDWLLCKVTIIVSRCCVLSRVCCGQAIGVAIGSLAARAARLNWNIALPALEIPTKFATTIGRPWLVSFTQLPLWAAWAAAIPALLATVLFFLDQNITARVANHPRFKQVKGRDADDLIAGMHGDMFVASILMIVTSVLGLPWMSGATTR